MNFTKATQKLKTPSVLLGILLLVLIGVLRFIDLGYSDYISDEPGTFFYRGGKKNPEMSKVEFVLSQRKGPIQLFVGYVPFVLAGNYNNELAQRIPFAAANVLGILVFYGFVLKSTKSSFLAFVSAFILGVNGLISAYGRIAQYQNLILLFNSVALYFFADLLLVKKRKISESRLLKSSLIGTFFICASFLSHWYGAFVLIPVILFVFVFFVNKKYSRDFKLRLFVSNVVLASVLILPFLIPYVSYQRENAENLIYADKIFGFGEPFTDRADKSQFTLYNPFYVYEVYTLGVVFSTILFIYGLIKKKPDPLLGIFIFWFLSLLFIFRFFISYSGLHFYHLFFPSAFLVGYLFYALHPILPHKLKLFPIIFTIIVLGFLYYQTFILFVDHTKEYPWETEEIFGKKTQSYSHEDSFRHKTGFPHKRYWKEISDFITTENAKNGIEVGYVTNEDKAIAKFYMAQPREMSSDGYYAIGIKKPNSFATDYKFPQIKNKHTIKKFENEFDKTVVNIYWVDKIPN